MATFLFLIGGEDKELYTMSDGVVRPRREMPLDEVIQWAEKDAIWANRGKAIQGYAQVESSLCSVMADLGGFPQETARNHFL